MAYFYKYSPEKDGHPDFFSLTHVDMDLFIFFLDEVKKKMEQIIPLITKESPLIKALLVGKMVYIACESQKIGLRLKIQNIDLLCREATVAVEIPFRGTVSDIKSILQEIVDIKKVSAEVSGVSLVFKLDLPEWEIIEVCYPTNGYTRRYYQSKKQ